MPIEYRTSQPRLRFCSSSSALAGSASGRSEVEVLIGERIPDERIVVRVGAPRECAERRRNPTHLDVEVALRPWPDAHVQRVGPHAAEVFRAHFAEQREMRPGLRRCGHIDPQQPQRRMLVVRVVEEARISRAETRGHVAADRHAPVRQRDRLRRQGLRAQR